MARSSTRSSSSTTQSAVCVIAPPPPPIVIAIDVDVDSAVAFIPLCLVVVVVVVVVGADQVVRFDEEGTLAALSAASNSTCFFVGRRKEKRVDADPASYMDGLGNWRECGVPGFSLT